MSTCVKSTINCSQLQDRSRYTYTGQDEVTKERKKKINKRRGKQITTLRIDLAQKEKEERQDEDKPKEK